MKIKRVSSILYRQICMRNVFLENFIWICVEVICEKKNYAFQRPQKEEVCALLLIKHLCLLLNIPTTSLPQIQYTMRCRMYNEAIQKCYTLLCRPQLAHCSPTFACCKIWILYFKFVKFSKCGKTHPKLISFRLEKVKYDPLINSIQIPSMETNKVIQRRGFSLECNLPILIQVDSLIYVSARGRVKEWCLVSLPNKDLNS